MKLKKLLALALASTMVFSMAACGDKKESDKKTGNVDKVTVETVLEAFKQYTENDDECYSYDMIMTMKIEAAEMSIELDSEQNVKANGGVKYVKDTSTTSMLGESDSTVTETYTITKEDGTVIEATKEASDDEWDVYEVYEEEDAENKVDIEELAKSAKIENDGHNYYVTATVNADEMGLTESGMMEDAEDVSVDVIITYNAKEKDITAIDIDMDQEIIESLFSALLGEVEVKEFTMKMENIKKCDETIEIPSDIELD